MRFFKVILPITGILLSTVFSGLAATLVWTNTAGGNWNTAANWNPNQVPGPADDAVIAASGTYTVTLNVSPNLNSLTLGGTSGQQTLTNAGFTLTLTNGGVVNANGILGMSGGTLAGRGLLTVTGLFNWTGGTIAGLANVTISINGVLNISGAGSKLLDGILSNAGTINWSGVGNLELQNNNSTVDGTLFNLAGAVFNIQNDQTLINFAGPEYISNAGLFRKLAGTGTTTIDTLFTNTGTLDVENGTVYFNNGGTSSGLFTNAAGTTITHANGTYTFLPAGQLTGAGTNLWSGGTVVAALPVTTANVVLAGATLLGTNSFTGAVSWTSGTIGGFANVTIPVGVVLNISGAGSKLLDGILSNAGTINWSGVGNLELQNNNSTVDGTLFNLAGAVFNIQNDQTLINFAGPEYISNAGLFRKLAGTGTTTIDTLFTNTGTLDVENGTVYFNNGGTSSGLFTNAAGTTITHANGTYTFLPAGQLTGAGTNLWSGGTVVAALPVTTANVVLAGATLLGTNSFTGAVSWTSGTIGGFANVTIPVGVVLNISGAGSKLLDGILSNAGTINWSGVGNLELQNNNSTVDGTLFNLAGAVFNIQNDQTLINFAGPEYISNAGLFRKLAGTGTTTIDTLFTNTGTLDVENGTVYFNNGGTSSGLFTNAAGTTITHANGTYTFLPAGQLTGAGTNLWSGGTVVAALPVTTANVVLAGATLLGTNSFTGAVSWTSGTIGGFANVTIPVGVVLNISGAGSKLLDGILSNAGTINWSGVGNLELQNNNSTVDGTLFNLAGAVFNIQNDQTLINFAGPEYISNAGLFRKLAGTGTTTIDTLFTNTGTLDVENGAISLTGARSLAKGTLNFGISSLSSFGRISLPGAATLTGTVSANLNNGYIPITNNSFTVLTYGSFSGLFTNTTLPFADAWQTNYTPTNFTLLVLNARPILPPIATQIITEWDSLTVTNPAVDLDQPPQTVTFSLATAPPTMSINTNTGILIWTPGQTNSPSTNAVTVVATDTGTPSLSASNSYFVIVREVNITPVPPNISGQTVNALALLTVTNTAFETNIHAVLSYTLVNAPTGTGIGTNGKFTWTPFRVQGPSTNIITTVVTSTDGFDLINPQLTATNTFVVVVYAPTLAAIENSAVNPGQTVSFTASATDNDPTRTLTFSITSGPGDIGLGSGLFNWRSPVASAGTFNNVQVTVTDNSAPPLSDSKSLSISVNPLAPLVLTALGYTNGQFTLQVSGTAGPDYILSSSTNLAKWNDISTNLSPATPFQFNDPAAGSFGDRFYRVRLAP